MDVAFLSRFQFALAISVHYIFPPISLGLGLILVILQCLYLKTNQAIYHQMVQFWIPVFAGVFGFGAITGFMMEHEINAHWASYAHFIKPAFGNILTSQAIVSFLLEFSLICLLFFGLRQSGKRYYLPVIISAAILPHLNALWIVLINSWQQDPKGFRLIGNELGQQVEITDWSAVLFNPSFIERISHVYTAAWLTGSFIIMGLGAYYLLNKRHLQFAQKSVQIGLLISLITVFLHFITGHFSALRVFHSQPAKLAAMEGHFDSNASADLYLLGWVDTKQQKTWGLSIPGGLSLLATGNSYTPIQGLATIPKPLQPPANFVFQAYHLMVTLGLGLVGLTLYGVWLWRTNRLFKNKNMLRLLSVSAFLPLIANQAGWYTAEVGRQPWLVYDVLQTQKGLTPTLPLPEAIASLVAGILIYLTLGSAAVYLLIRKIKCGPAPESPTVHTPNNLGRLYRIPNFQLHFGGGKSNSNPHPLWKLAYRVREIQNTLFAE
jgi:cytochrome bd ubiquinol oxidase subunit I